MANLAQEINDVLIDFINVDRTAHVLDINEYWALERIAVILSKHTADPLVDAYDFSLD